MGVRTTLVALCCVSLVILSATAFRVNDATEAKFNEAVESVEIAEAPEVETKVKAENSPSAQHITVQYQDEVQEDTAELADEILTSLNIKDTNGRSKFINNQFIPDDLSSVNPKPLFDLLQQETNQKNPPKPLAVEYDNFSAPTVVYDKETEDKVGNTFQPPKPTKVPGVFCRPVVQSSATNASNKVHIKFKTVSSSSQFVATPVANLLLKLEIGIAEPSQPINDGDTVELSFNSS